MSRSQQTAINSADDIINDHLKSSDLSAALGDLQGNPIAKPNEITFYSDKMISILFRGDNECYVVNYNLETGEEMEIGQNVSSDVIMELLKNEEEPFFKDILKKAIEEKNINDKLTDFFIWERGIGLIAWPSEGGGRDYIITYFNLDENEITWEL